MSHLEELEEMNDQSAFKRFLKRNKKCLIITGIVIALIVIASLVVLSVFGYIYSHTEPVRCRCKLGVNKRIVNGKIASRNFIPYQVSLATGSKSTHYCSGVIINAHWILTAVSWPRTKD